MMGSSVGAGMNAGPGPISVPQPRPSHIYQPTYQGMGLSSTPQANYFTPQMPTYSRPTTMPMQPSGGLFSNRSQPAYSIPYRTSPAGAFSGLMGSLGRLNRTLGRTNAVAPSTQSLPTTGYRIPYMTMGQYKAVNAPPPDVSSNNDGGGG